MKGKFYHEEERTMDKRKRELSKAIKPYGYRIVGFSGKTHFLLRNRKTGHEMTAACSPTNPDHSIKAVLRGIKQHGGVK